MADAQGSGPCERNLMQVQVLSSAPTHLRGISNSYQANEQDSLNV